MTFGDMEAVERHVAAVAAEMGAPRPPVMHPVDYARVDVDMTYMPATDPHEFAELLGRSLRLQGYVWDVWVNGPLVSVSEKEEAE